MPLACMTNSLNNAKSRIRPGDLAIIHDTSGSHDKVPAAAAARNVREKRIKTFPVRRLVRKDPE